MTTRQQILETIYRQPEVSVLIIGAGINGIGVFRDLALQGVDTLLVDKADFCAGASAASSHMVHGGLRYLENGEFRLVKEALTERNRLLQNAPHYVHPLPTTIPIFKWFSGILNAPLKFVRLRDRPGERGALVIKIGLTLYDLFTRGQQTLPSHRFTSRGKSLQQRPLLNPDIVCTATYYDAWMPMPERIGLELILDAEADCPQAKALNYVRVVGAHDGVVMLHDELGGQTLEVKPNIVVNATGAWIDFTNRALRRETGYIGGTKGAHLVVDHRELLEATQGHEIFFENRDGRIVLILPLEDKVLMGTTDIPVSDPETVAVTEEEVDYILGLANKVFPSIKVDRSHIVFWFTGVRPLPSSSAKTAGQISRDHTTHVLEPGGGIDFPIYSLVGGKWTTYRAFSEQVTDLVLARLNKIRRADTRTLPIGGGKGYPRIDAAKVQWISTLQAKTGLSTERLHTLFKRYGTYAEEIASFLGAELDEGLRHHPAYSRREIEFLVTCEKVVHLDDVLLRRSSMAMLGEVDGGLLEEIAGIMGSVLGWSHEEMQREIERTAQLLQTKHGVRPEQLQPSPQTKVYQK